MQIKIIFHYILLKIGYLNIKSMYKKKIERYISDIINQNPSITSGRKNYEFLYKRILKQISLVKKFKKKISNRK